MINLPPPLPLYLRVLVLAIVVAVPASWWIHRSIAQSRAQIKPSSATGFNTWTTHGPAGNPGIYALAMDPGNSNVIYAASTSKIYKSTDSGTTGPVDPSWTVMPPSSSEVVFQKTV